MDPNILQLLEDDEDTTMHSEADMEAFSADLSRYMEGNTSGELPHGSSSISNQLAAKSQPSYHDGHNNAKDKDVLKNSFRNSYQVEMKQHVPGSKIQEARVDHPQEHIQLELQHKHEQAEQKSLFSRKSDFQVSHFGEQDRMRQPEILHQYPKILKMDNQQVAAESEICNKQTFGRLLQEVTPNLDKDKAMQVQRLYTKLRKNEIDKDGFTSHMRKMVGDEMLIKALQKITMPQDQTKAQFAQNLQMKSHQLEGQYFSSLQQQVKMHQKDPGVPADPTQISTAKVKVQSDSGFPIRGNDVQKRESEPKSGCRGMIVNQVSSSSMHATKINRVPSIEGLNKNQQQHVHPPQASYPMHGPHIRLGKDYPHSYSAQSVRVSSTNLKPQAHSTQVKQVPFHQSMLPTQSGGTTRPMCSLNNQHLEMQNSSADSKRLQGNSEPIIKQEVLDQTQDQHISQKSASSSSSSFSPKKFLQGNPARPVTDSVLVSMPTQLDSLMQVHAQFSSTTTSLGWGTNINTPPEKPSIGKKKPLDTLGVPSSFTNKKQKVSGTLMDEVKHFNDVTTVSGVDLREEEKQLFSGPKEENQTLEAIRKVVQEEERKLILENVPFQKKMAKIMSKCGIKNVDKDAELCLSLCLEERIRGLISNLIRLSKKRSDTERPRHRNIITSDVRRQILAINQRRKEDLEKKQSEEAEKLQKSNEADGDIGPDGDKDKDKSSTKPVKANKDKNEKMRTNVAFRAAVGGDDMLSKWKLMAEQARQERGEVVSTSMTHMGKDVSLDSFSNTGRTSSEIPDGENRNTSTAVTSGIVKKFGRNPAIMPHKKAVRTISVKDVIAVLEREPQMLKSTFVLRLYERMGSEARI